MEMRSAFLFPSKAGLVTCLVTSSWHSSLPCPLYLKPRLLLAQVTFRLPAGFVLDPWSVPRAPEDARSVPGKGGAGRLLPWAAVPLGPVTARVWVLGPQHHGSPPSPRLHALLCPGW